jgi:hypothetical protein
MFWGGKHYPGDGGPGIPYYDADILYSQSTNKGVTWSVPIRANANDTLYHAPGGDRLIRLKSGRIIYPTAVTVNGDASSQTGNYTAFVIYSDNNGTTWNQLNTGITSPSLLAVEPGLYQRKDDTLTMYFRTRNNWVYASNSKNNGLTWSAAYNFNLQAGNTLTTVKYIKEIDALVAAYNPLGFNTATGLPVTSSQDVRQNLSLTTSINNGLSWGNNRFIFRGFNDSLVTIEPNFLYDPILRNIHIFHSPSGNSLLNYAYKQDIVKLYDVVNLSSRNTLYSNAQKIAINQKSTQAAPSDLLDIELTAQGGGTPGVNADYGLILANKTTNNFLAIGNGLSSGSWLGEIRMQSLTGRGRFYAITNGVSSVIPALEFASAKNGGASSLASADIAARFSTGVTTLSTLFGNGDYTITGNFSCALLSNPKIFDVLRLRQGAGLRLNATIGVDASTDGGLFQSAGNVTLGDYATGTKSITVNTTTGVVSAAGKVGIGSTTTPSVGLQMFSSDAFKVASGTTAQQPTAAAGYFRHNSDLNKFEGSGTGATYYPFDQTLLSATTNTTVTNTTAVSTLATVSIPANSLAPGQTIRIMVEGFIQTDATSPGNLRVGVVYGTDTLYSAVGGLRPIAGGAAKTFTANFSVRISAAGATGTVRVQGFAQQQADSTDPQFYGGWYPFSNPTLANTTVNTTTAKNLALFGQFGTALATNGISITNATILRQ